jgi:hypothetical protein
MAQLSMNHSGKLGRLTCPKCGRVFKVRLQCPRCSRPVSRRDLRGDPYLLMKHQVRLDQRTRLLRGMQIDLLGVWVGRSRERRKLALAAKGLADDFQFPAPPGWTKLQRKRRRTDKLDEALDSIPLCRLIRGE